MPTSLHMSLNNAVQGERADEVAQQEQQRKLEEEEVSAADGAAPMSVGTRSEDEASDGPRRGLTAKPDDAADDEPTEAVEQDKPAGLVDVVVDPADGDENCEAEAAADVNVAVEEDEDGETAPADGRKGKGQRAEASDSASSKSRSKRLSAASQRSDDANARGSSSATKGSKGKGNSKRLALVAVMEGGSAPRNVKDWAAFVARCEEVLAADDELLVKARSKLRKREASHKDPIAKELSEGGDALTLRQLCQVERRAVGEIGADDRLVRDIRARIKAREASHKTELVARYTKLMKGKLKDMSVRSLNEFARACEAELDPDDPLVAQSRSAVEARVLDKGDPAKAKKVGRSKKDADAAAQSASSRKDKPAKSATGDVILKIPGMGGRDGDLAEKGSLTSVFGAVAHEFGGQEDSMVYKAFFLFSFMLFAYILLAYLQLVLKIAPPKLFDDAGSSAASAAASAVVADSG